jgi:hypothetical protein
MTLGVAAWLIVLAALAVLFIVVLRRMSVLVARTRDLERFQHGTRTLDGRLALTIEPLVSRLDEIRRRAGDPQALATNLEPAQATLHELAAEARRLRAPAALAPLRSAFIDEIERAGRAADMVEHGLDALVAGRSGRELEAQTSLKRGALNLRHAREASGALVARIAAVRPADLIDREGRGRGSPTAGGPGSAGRLPTYLVDGYEPDDVGQHPRM